MKQPFKNVLKFVGTPSSIVISETYPLNVHWALYFISGPMQANPRSAQKSTKSTNNDVDNHKILLGYNFLTFFHT